METIVLSTEHYETLLRSLEQIKSQNKTNTDIKFIDNQEFIQLMKISKRTSAYWRQKGKIPFAKIGNKIYYKVTDVEALLQQHYIHMLN